MSQFLKVRLICSMAILVLGISFSFPIWPGAVRTQGVFIGSVVSGCSLIEDRESYSIVRCNFGTFTVTRDPEVAFRTAQIEKQHAVRGGTPFLGYIGNSESQFFHAPGSRTPAVLEDPSHGVWSVSQSPDADLFELGEKTSFIGPTISVLCYLGALFLLATSLFVRAWTTLVNRGDSLEKSVPNA